MLELDTIISIFFKEDGNFNTATDYPLLFFPNKIVVAEGLPVYAIQKTMGSRYKSKVGVN